MSKVHVSEIVDVMSASPKQIRAINPDCSFSLDEIDYEKCLSGKYYESDLKGAMINVYCKGRCKNLSIRVYPAVLLSIARKDRKDINLILVKKNYYFHIEEAS